MIHRVKSFGIFNREEIDVFLELSCFFDDSTDVGNLISCSSAFSKTSLNIWKFMVHILLKPGLENFEHYFTSMWDDSLSILWHCLSLGLEWKLTFPSPVAPVELSKFAGILSAALSQYHLLRIWNSSTGVPSPPLALYLGYTNRLEYDWHHDTVDQGTMLRLMWLKQNEQEEQ